MPGDAMPYWNPPPCAAASPCCELLVVIRIIGAPIGNYARHDEHDLARAA